MADRVTKEEIFNELKTILTNELEIEEADVRLEANLFEDLDLDSIDAVDLAVRVQQFTMKKIPPENFKQIKTIGDVVSTIEELL